MIIALRKIVGRFSDPVMGGAFIFRLRALLNVLHPLSLSAVDFVTSSLLANYLVYVIHHFQG